MWNGAAEALNPSPPITSASPATRSASCERCCAATAWAISPKRSAPVAPYTSAEPKSSIAESVTLDRGADHAVAVRREPVEQRCGDDGAHEAERADGRAEGPPRTPRQE